jgi:serine/threonine protein kinase
LLSNRRADDPQNQRIFARQMVDVLIYLHSLNIFHNDIRPENIIISSDWSIKLVEFGVSAYRPDGKCKQLLGSALYMAPEKLFGESYNNGADWYAFGMTLYELIYKNNPFAHLGKKKDLMKSVKEGIPELGGSTADNFISMLCNTDQNLRWCPANGKEKDIMTHDFLQDPPHIHKQASIGDLRIVESGPIASLEDFSTRGD